MTGLPFWAQVNPVPENQAPSTGTDVPAPAVTVADTTTPAITEDRMQVPPPVSTAAYPTTYSAEERSNYLRGGLTFTTAYNDNVFTNAAGNPESDVSYAVFPNISLDETTSRLHFVLSYAPGYTFYQRKTSGDQSNQNLSANLRYRLAPHVTLSLGDSLIKSSSLLNQPGLPTTVVTGNPQGGGVPVIAPLTNQTSNYGSAELTWQFSANGMVGANGSFGNLHFANSSQVPGLADSSSQGGSAFYSQRVGKKHYFGASYQYQRILSYPIGAQSETQTHAVLGFYTFYPTPTLSFSVSAGPQHSENVQFPLPPSRSWSPAVTASAGWQGRHTGLAASYSRIVSGGGGLIGAFHSNSASVSVRQQLTRNWSAQAVGAYSINKTVTPFFFLASPGGHSVSGSASIQRILGPHVNAAAGYTRLHQSYSSVPAISSSPDTNREWISISYQFARPLGR